MEKKIKVKLTTDLTKYHRGLVPGVEGYTVGNQSMWSRGSDRFVTVCFPGIHTLDVLWKSLEVIDEEAIAEDKRHHDNLVESLKSAHDVTLHLGPRGGFRALSIQYTDAQTGASCGRSIGPLARQKAYDIMEILRGYGIPIQEVIDK